MTRSNMRAVYSPMLSGLIATAVVVPAVLLKLVLNEVGPDRARNRRARRAQEAGTRLVRRKGRTATADERGAEAFLAVGAVRASRASRAVLTTTVGAAIGSTDALTAVVAVIVVVVVLRLRAAVGSARVVARRGGVAPVVVGLLLLRRGVAGLGLAVGAWRRGIVVVVVTVLAVAAIVLLRARGVLSLLGVAALVVVGLAAIGSAAAAVVVLVGHCVREKVRVEVVVRRDELINRAKKQTRFGTGDDENNEEDGKKSVVGRRRGE